MAAKPNILNIAHRGARSLAPENTLAAARLAVAAGANMWELDVNMSADGELVVLHDDTLERTSNARLVFPERAPWKVNDFTLDELRRLDFGSWYVEQDPYQQIAAGKVSEDLLKSYVGLPIPTLQEALEFTQEHHFRVNVEIKDLSGTPQDRVVVEKVVDLIDRLRMTDRVLLSSFHHGYIERSREINPMIETAALIEEAVANPLALLARLGARALNPDLALTTPEMIQSLRMRGYDVFVWTVNEEIDMQRLMDAGVSGIITDYPQRLRHLLEA
jgi:glycerophosphoryl diester phosphodiesterase